VEGSCEHDSEPSENILGNSCVAERLAVSQGGFSSMS
jgi:hypothetical protein